MMKSERERQAIAALKRDELTEKLVVTRFANPDWEKHDNAYGTIASARKFAQLILESHEGEI